MTLSALAIENAKPKAKPYKLSDGDGLYCWGIVAKAIEFTTEMVCANAGLHADQARRQVGKSSLHLAARSLLAQHNGTTLIMTDDMERVLADIDADDGDGSLGGLGHGVLLVVGAPCQL